MGSNYPTDTGFLWSDETVLELDRGGGHKHC